MTKEEQDRREEDRQAFNPMNDVAFKFIFGKEERKQITIDFLNTVLERSLGHEIQDIAFRQTEMLPDGDEGKLSRLDIACELDSGELVDVEVQVVNYNNMQRRTLFYWARLYLLSLTRGEGYSLLRPAITINLLAFELLPQENPVAMYSIYNIENGDRLNSDMELHFIELPKYMKAPRKTIRESSKMERWLAYFANRLTEEEKEELAMSEPAIRDAMEAEKIFMSSPDEYLRYVNRQMALMDYRSGLQAAAQEGFDQGISQGISQGRQIGIAHMALNMLRAGTPLATVAQMAELPEAAIREMAEEHGIQIP